MVAKGCLLEELFRSWPLIDGRLRDLCAVFVDGEDVFPLGVDMHKLRGGEVVVEVFGLAGGDLNRLRASLERSIESDRKC